MKHFPKWSCKYEKVYFNIELMGSILVNKWTRIINKYNDGDIKGTLKHHVTDYIPSAHSTYPVEHPSTSVHQNILLLMLQ